MLTAGAGVALLAWGTISFDWSLALSGLPLAALGVAVIFARHRSAEWLQSAPRPKPPPDTN